VLSGETILGVELVEEGQEECCSRNRLRPRILLVGPVGIEPTTFGLKARFSRFCDMGASSENSLRPGCLPYGLFRRFSLSDMCRGTEGAQAHWPAGAVIAQGERYFPIRRLGIHQPPASIGREDVVALTALNSRGRSTPDARR
jgi:hypothetical protein